MKIALYVPSLRGGGAERVMVHLANGFVSLGHHVDLVLAQAEGPYLKDVDARARLVDLGAGRVSKSLPALVRYMRSSRPDCMLSALPHANVIAIMARFLARTHTRLVIAEHNTVARTAAGKRGQKNRLAGFFMPSLMRATYRFADAIVAVSDGAAVALAQLLGAPRSRVSVIHNPVVADTILSLASEPLAHPWITRDDRPFILAAGRLTEAKDHPALLRAFARVRTQRDARLVILGEGELRSRLERLSEELGIVEDTLMPGFVENPYAWMRACAVFVLSSAREGCPMVLIEAMACGAPIVSTDCPSGPSEILEDGRWGRLVPVGDVESMTSAILEAMQAPRLTEGVTHGRGFTPDHVFRSYIDILKGSRA